MVFLGALLVHLRDPVRALERILATLIPGGELYQLEAVSLKMSVLHGRQPMALLQTTDTMFNWRYPNRAALYGWLDTAGFTDIRTLGFHHPPMAADVRLVRRDGLAPARLIAQLPDLAVSPAPRPRRRIRSSDGQLRSADADHSRGARRPAALRLAAFVVPVVVGELLAGIALGKTGAGLIKADDPTIAFLGNIGFAVLMMVAGMHVPLRNRGCWARSGGAASRSLVSAALGVAGGLAIAHVLGFGHPAVWAILLATGSAAIVLPALEEAGVSADRALLAMAWATVADVATIVAVPLVLEPSHAVRAGLGALAVAAGAVSSSFAARLLARNQRIHSLRDESAHPRLGARPARRARRPVRAARARPVGRDEHHDRRLRGRADRRRRGRAAPPLRPGHRGRGRLPGAGLLRRARREPQRAGAGPDAQASSSSRGS